MANWADSFVKMYQLLWNELIYKLLAFFGIEKDEEGNLVKKDAE